MWLKSGRSGMRQTRRSPPGSKSRIEPVKDMGRDDNDMSAQSVIERAAATPDFLAAPGPSFDHPSEVLARADIPVAERRAILAAWASDAHATKTRRTSANWRTGRASRSATFSRR
jgi:hypothetical protein